jgi:hypothetical protein
MSLLRDLAARQSGGAADRSGRATPHPSPTTDLPGMTDPEGKETDEHFTTCCPLVKKKYLESEQGREVVCTSAKKYVCD